MIRQLKNAYVNMAGPKQAASAFFEESYHG